MIENNTCKAVHIESINIEMRKQGRKQDEGEREGDLTFFLLYISSLAPSGEAEGSER